MIEHVWVIFLFSQAQIFSSECDIHNEMELTVEIGWKFLSNLSSNTSISFRLLHIVNRNHDFHANQQHNIYAERHRWYKHQAVTQKQHENYEKKKYGK